MDNNQKLFIDNFVKNPQKNDAEFDLVLEKLNEFLSPFFNEIVQENNNAIFFDLKLVGDEYLGTNFDYLNAVNIMIETYYANMEDLSYSQNREKKGEIGKLLVDTFNYNKSLLPTTETLINLLFKYCTLKGQNLKLYRRKNCIYIRFLDYKFSLFFVEKKPNTSYLTFTIRGKKYNFDFNLMNKNLIEKNKQTNGNFFNLIRFYKIIENELTLINKLKICASRNLYFYENLLYNLPNELLNDNYIYDIFLKSYNYLLINFKEKKLNEFIDSSLDKLICDDYELFAKPYITTRDIKLVLTNLKTFLNNIDEIFNQNQQSDETMKHLKSIKND